MIDPLSYDYFRGSHFTFWIACLSLPLHTVQAKAFSVFDMKLIPIEASTSMSSRSYILQI